MQNSDEIGICGNATKVHIIFSQAPYISDALLIGIAVFIGIEICLSTVKDDVFSVTTPLRIIFSQPSIKIKTSYVLTSCVFDTRKETPLPTGSATTFEEPSGLTSGRKKAP